MVKDKVHRNENWVIGVRTPVSHDARDESGPGVGLNPERDDNVSLRAVSVSTRVD